jgi:hypothetical protein
MICQQSQQVQHVTTAPNYKLLVVHKVEVCSSSRSIIIILASSLQPISLEALTVWSSQLLA